MISDSGPTYLPRGLPTPVAEPDGLSAPYWAGLRQNRLLVQRCRNCESWQFGPEWLCHRCKRSQLERPSMACSNIIHKPIRPSRCCSGR